MGSQAIDFRPGLFVGAGEGGADEGGADEGGAGEGGAGEGGAGEEDSEILDVEFYLVMPGKPKECQTSCGFKNFQIRKGEKLLEYMNWFKDCCHFGQKVLTFEFYYEPQNDTKPLVGPLTGEETPAYLGMHKPGPEEENTYRFNCIKLYTYELIVIPD